MGALPALQPGSVPVTKAPGHPGQPPPASAVLATRSLLFLKLPLMAQGHPHSCPGAEGQTVSAVGHLLPSPCMPPVLSRVPLP